MAESHLEALIGLEIHARLLTESKMFSPDSARFTAKENHHVHPVSLGFPGTLPVVNRKAIVLAVKAAKAFSGQIQTWSAFARKSYFYPDLPKGYQISQHTKPYCLGGKIIYKENGEWASAPLERIHLEEDAGQLMHTAEESLVNFNRAGVPLLEIVTLPALKSPESAALCAKAARAVLTSIGACDGNLEEGSMRFDCNISLRRKGASSMGVKVELKNLNSFRFMEKALKLEAKRQKTLLDKGLPVQRETRGYDASRNITVPLRAKEEAGDYRYFPDPDLAPLNLEGIEAGPLPELPHNRQRRLENDYGLPAAHAGVLTEEGGLGDYFEKLAQTSQDPKGASHWVLGPLKALLKEHGKTAEESPVPPSALGALMGHVQRGEISASMGRQILTSMWETGQSAKDIMEKQGLRQISDKEALLKMAQKVIALFPRQRAEYLQGKEKLLAFFVGQAMKESRGRAAPQALQAALKKALSEAGESAKEKQGG